jgi:DnaJ-class molecular chaperone
MRGVGDGAMFSRGFWGGNESRQAMGKHGKKQACGSCGGKGWVKVNLDNKEEKITCRPCNGSGEV